MKRRAHVPWLLPPTCQVELHLSVRHTGIFLEVPISVLTPEVPGRQQQLGGEGENPINNPTGENFPNHSGDLAWPLDPGRCVLRDSKEAEAGGNHSVYLQEGREKGTKISLFYTFLCCSNFVLGIFMHSRIIYYLFFIPQHAPWSLCPTFWLFSRGNGAAVIRRQRHANKVLVPVPWNGREICILKGTPSHFYSAL